jgi:hypothetical protein
MSTIWMAISPGPRTTRVLAMASASNTILKAQLSPAPAHPRALPTLLEAVALWQGEKVHAALVAAERDGVSDSSLYRDAFALEGEPLYALEWVPTLDHVRPRPRDRSALGDFADLRQLLMFEVAR